MSKTWGSYVDCMAETFNDLELRTEVLSTLLKQILLTIRDNKLVPTGEGKFIVHEPRPVISIDAQGHESMVIAGALGWKIEVEG